ncbi:hypothetical protein CC86DRAFT_379665 [Ophiobolus disseminans]|uniref:Uncharacterized protein n=1 Tax=Ophiobolus disseminans TaxID=1469910 RepID=A0A6A7AAP2_9PLEO|nr:hypothetical protein CC86DRAFT_379665 [Ophiobolus disseminans]
MESWQGDRTTSPDPNMIAKAQKLAKEALAEGAKEEEKAQAHQRSIEVKKKQGQAFQRGIEAKTKQFQPNHKVNANEPVRRQEIVSPPRAHHIPRKAVPQRTRTDSVLPRPASDEKLQPKFYPRVERPETNAYGERGDRQDGDDKLPPKFRPQVKRHETYAYGQHSDRPEMFNHSTPTQIALQHNKPTGHSAACRIAS